MTELTPGKTLYDKNGAPRARVSDDGKGILFGPPIVEDGKVIGFIDSEYLELGAAAQLFVAPVNSAELRAVMEEKWGMVPNPPPIIVASTPKLLVTEEENLTHHLVRLLEPAKEQLDFYIPREPRVRDWEQRKYKRPRRR